MALARLRYSAHRHLPLWEAHVRGHALLGQAGTRRRRRRAVRQLLEESDSDLSISGPTLAAEALGAGLVDEVSLYVSPVSVGGGTPALPLGSRYDLRLHEERVVGDVIVLRSAVGRVRD